MKPSPSPDLHKQHPFAVLWPYLLKATPWAPLWIGLCVLCVLCCKGSMLAVPLFYKKIVDQLALDHPVQTIIWGLVAAYGLMRLSERMFFALQDVLFARIQQRATRHLAREIFAHLHQLSWRFHLDRQTGSLTRIIDRGTAAIDTFFKFFIFNLCPTLLELVLIIGLIFAFYPPLFSGVLLVALVLYVGFTFVVAQWRLQFMRAFNQASNASGAQAIDSLLNYTTTKFFGNEAAEVARYDQSLAIIEEEMIRSKLSLSFLNFGQGIILTGGIVAIMGLGVVQMQKGHFTVGDFVLLNTYLLQVYSPLNILGFAYRELRQSVVDMGDLFQLRHIQPEIQDAPQPLTHVSAQDIEFKNVTFGYSSARMILQNLSFTIPAGKTVALVGTSGAGKSTVVSLLLRFFDPQEGGIFIGGRNIRDFSQEALRKAFGVVPQDTVLFNDTLFYNIAYGRLEAPRDEVMKAAEQARLADFVKRLPETYDTIVGERGLKLSGGEKQRVAIARVILKNPLFLIFDEATSSLDTHTERDIQDNLTTLSHNRSTLIIAHRLSTVTHAHQIIVLDQGCIAERGTHQELLDHKGLYAALWTRQQKEAKSAEAPVDF